MNLSTENILLIGSVLLFFSLLTEKVPKKFGIPILLLFISIGMLAGSDGIGRIHFDDPHTAQFIGMMALAIILFSGGMHSKYKEIKPVMLPGVLLATLGIILTTLFTGLFIFWLTNHFFEKFTFTLFESLLLASVVASTDAAAVFSILPKGMRLKYHLRHLLELESESNDPMAYMLMITFLPLVQHQGHSALWIVGIFFYELFAGLLCGFLLGKATVKIINKINMSNHALYPILLIIMFFVLFSVTEFIHGNGFLAVYIGGVIVGNSKLMHKRSSKSFFDGFTWFAQITMFLTLGLLLNPSELLPVAGLALVIGIFMIIFARPLAVWGCLFPFRAIPPKAKFYVSWVGLRGAVPIIFATYLLAANIEHGRIMFNIVFFITLLSLLVQGTLVPFVARALGLVEPKPLQLMPTFDTEAEEETKTAMSEIVIRKQSLKEGDCLLDMPVPENTRVVVAKRGDHYFIPKGNTKLEPRDILYIISDDEEGLREACGKLGIRHYHLRKQK
ncbi:MAG: potassium/proton antiporter [Bacteroidetes bacterium]|nr:potassium/proton antiporter [Bacteroidota bacterium]MCL2301696.1 potassium/proton antiporter [Lentimicrobiaceae bacterium]